MQIVGEPKKVKLKVDLTKYDSRCRVGEIGQTIPDVKFSIWEIQIGLLR